MGSSKIQTVVRQFLQQHLSPQHQRLVLGYSGGRDSAVLLDVLVSLQAEHQRPIHVVHVHHGLSPNAHSWATHSQNMAAHYGVTCQILWVEVSRQGSLEESARLARYQALNQVLAQGDVLLLAHHQHDQAETVLLRLLRGSGVTGLAAIRPLSIVPFNIHAMPVWRPLLTVSRLSIDDYAQHQQLQWIEDESNQNIDFARNYLRHEILPRLSTKWGPQTVAVLAETATRMQESEQLLIDLAEQDYQLLQVEQGSIAIEPLATLSSLRQQHVLRYWLQQQQWPLPDRQGLQAIWAEVCLARVDAQAVYRYGHVEVRRYRQRLYVQYRQTQEPQARIWQDKSQGLVLPELSCVLVAQDAIGQGIAAEIWQQAEVEVRFRQGGEVIRPAGTLHHRPLKKLWQETGIPPWLRHTIPLVYINQQLAMVLGYWIADEFVASTGQKAVLITQNQQLSVAKAGDNGAND